MSAFDPKRTLGLARSRSARLGFMSATLRKKLVLSCGVVAAALLFISIIEVDVPPHLRGELVTQGRVSDCDIRRIGRHGGEIFVGISLATPDAPYLRVQAPSEERDRYEALCARRPVVEITYHAVQRVYGPVRFWVDRIVEH